MAGDNDAEPVGCRDAIRMHGGAGWFTRAIIRRPIAIAAGCFAVPLFISLIAFQVYPLELETGGGSWYPRESEVGRREDGLVAAEEQTVFSPTSDDPASIVTETQRSLSEVITIYYWREDGGNIITTAGLEKMRQVEKFVYNRSGFSDVCLLNSNGVCLEAKGLTSYVYSSAVSGCSQFRNPNGSGVSQWDSSVNAMLEPILNSSATQVYCSGCGTDCAGQGEDALEDFVTTSFTPENMYSSAAKSIIRFGLPLVGYSNAYDRRSEQIDKTEDFIRGLTSALFEGGLSGEGITVRAVNGALLEAHFAKLLRNDSIWILLSIALVGVFILIHTGAPFLTCFGMLHVILSFPFSYFFLQLFFDIGAMGVLNFLGIFIILGIGADDIFILLDAWKQSAAVFADLDPDDIDPQAREKHLAERLHWTYVRASGAMLVTSVTTSAAFMMNIVSSVIPIQVFGIQVAFMVMSNYVFVVTYYPAIVIVWEWYNIHKWCPWCRPCKKNKVAADGGNGLSKPLDEERIETGGNGKSMREHDAVDNIEDYRPLERFLHNQYGPWIYKSRWYTLVGFVCFAILCIVFATQIEVSSEPAKWVPDSDPVQEVLNLQRDQFKAGSPPQIAVLAGLDEISRKGTNRFNSQDIGNPMFIAINMTSELAQQTYVDNCNRIMDWNYVQASTVENTTGVLCPMIEFKNYVENTLNETFPVPASEFTDKLLNFTAYIVWTEGPGLDASLYTTLDERNNRRQSPMGLQQTIRWHKGQNPPVLAYLVTVVNTTMVRGDSAGKVKPVFNYFEERTAALPTVPGYSTSFQTCNLYLWMRLEEGLLKDAFFSIAVSIVLSFVIVAISTRSIALSLVATLTIGCIVLAMLANLVWMGWKISILESICLTVLVGLSVDYTIHLGNSWMKARSTNRVKRLNAALLEIGISVLAAAATTVLSALPLLLTIIIFFFRFGAFIILNVVYSTIFAFGLFVTILVICGPVSGRDDFYWAFLKIQGKDTAPAYTSQEDGADNTEFNEDGSPSRQKSPVVMNAIDPRSVARTSSDFEREQPHTVTSL